MSQPMKMRNIYFVLLSFVFAMPSQAQVAKTIIVEHTTNTVCGICSNRNPGFYDNLNSQPGVLHLSIHPSSPYSSCILNQHNPEENDARTEYYGIYGSTPKLVIQGQNIPVSTNYGDPDLWNPYIAQSSPVSIQIEQNKTADLIQGRVTITTEETNDLAGLKLFVALAEDTVFYNAPNGEDLHFDVFRKALPNTDGFEVILAENIGESVVFDVEMAPNAEWDLDRMFFVVILQEADTKDVVQAAATTTDQSDIILSQTEIPTLENVRVSPNPVQHELTIALADQSHSTVRIYNILGELILENNFVERTQLNTSELTIGTYLIEIINDNGRFIDKLVRN